MKIYLIAYNIKATVFAVAFMLRGMCFFYFKIAQGHINGVLYPTQSHATPICSLIAFTTPMLISFRFSLNRFLTKMITA